MKLVCKKQAKPFILEETAYEGVKRIAAKVCEDVCRVSEVLPKMLSYEEVGAVDGVLVATVGKSAMLNQLEKDGVFISSDLTGLREVYRIDVVKIGKAESLVIAGSDKRGTIYGLFAVSKAIGVSPLVYWADVPPVHRDEIELPESLFHTSKEPSVRHRGFFINDEFPSFGNWAIEKFGGFTAEMYDKVFELLLRMNGNYLWPAMWVSSFPLDGPGLLNAELADLYGVVIGNSHHEPCLRASEEWDKVKGPNSGYGQEWNYYINRDGLLRYWEEGLKRSGKYEGIITVGMRGERDTSMLGPDSTLEQNIELLKDIITQQKELIRKHVNEDLSQVTMMLALYKEVEAYYYGDETTPGLKDWDGLENITLMLCEDNYGNMRTLPTAEMRKHNGGFGMYYHLDYHGGPISYEWVNSTPIAKVWEQMSEAYEYGIRDIWIVNVGDLKPQEFPLSFFMDLAYDFECYGTKALNRTKIYTREFIEKQFGGAFSEDDLNVLAMVLEEYTRMNGMRRPEALHPQVYHTAHFEENKRMCRRGEQLIALCNSLRANCKKEYLAAFIELIYYPAVASANLLLMQLWAGMNAFYAQAGMSLANRYATRVERTIEHDAALIEEYHGIADGKWNHMMSSNHVGFINWNDEGWSFPQCVRVEENGKKMPAIRMQGESDIILIEKGLVEKTYQISCTAGKRYIELLSTTAEEMQYCTQVCGDILSEEEKDSYNMKSKLHVSYPPGEPGEAGRLTIQFGNGELCRIVFERVKPGLVGHVPQESLIADYPGETSVTKKITGIGAYLALEAGDYIAKTEVDKATYKILTDYGRVKDTAKIFPCTRSFTAQEACSHQSPELIYEVETCEAGEYDCTLYISPTNPRYPGDEQRIAIGTSLTMQVLSTLPEGFDAGNCHNPQWNQNVLDNIRECRVRIKLANGLNRIHVAAVDAGVMLQRLVICAPGGNVPASYLGPIEE